MSFFGIGGNQQKPQAQQSQGGQQQNGGQGAAPNGQQNPNANPNDPNAQNQQKVNPLDVYSTMFDNPPEAGKAPEFTLDPEVLNKAASGQNFTDGLPPELKQRIQAGDGAAMMEAINLVGQGVYRTSIEHAGMLTGKFVGARETWNNKNLPSHVRGELTQNELSSIPNSQHPVVKKQLIETAKRLQAQNPDATPAEIAKMTKDYFTELTNAMNPDAAKGSGQGKQSPEAEVRGPEFWDKYFDEEPEFTPAN